MSTNLDPDPLIDAIKYADAAGVFDGDRIYADIAATMRRRFPALVRTPETLTQREIGERVYATTRDKGIVAGVIEAATLTPTERTPETLDVERLRQQNHDAAAKRDRETAKMEQQLARYRNAYERARELVRGSPVDWSKDANASKPDGWWNYTSERNRDIIAAAVLAAATPPPEPAIDDGPSIEADDAEDWGDGRPTEEGIAAVAEPGLREALRLDQPWPVTSVLERLANYVDHGMSSHSCDHLGYEGDTIARDAAREINAALRALPAEPQPAIDVGRLAWAIRIITRQEDRGLKESDTDRLIVEYARPRPQYPGRQKPDREHRWQWGENHGDGTYSHGPCVDCTEPGESRIPLSAVWPTCSSGRPTATPAGSPSRKR